ncbi:MAG: hypothetical protein IT441_02290 [Phycisphaeraceae bacterium]|nr:hypothetical protein [Phycisphaeraceae bacterium]
MIEGFIPTHGGIYWFTRDERYGFLSFARALPGTTTWMRLSKLEAYRCPACRLVTFRYGKVFKDADDLAAEQALPGTGFPGAGAGPPSD